MNKRQASIFMTVIRITWWLGLAITCWNWIFVLSGAWPLPSLEKPPLLNCLNCFVFGSLDGQALFPPWQNRSSLLRTGHSPAAKELSLFWMRFGWIGVATRTRVAFQMRQKGLMPRILTNLDRSCFCLTPLSVVVAAVAKNSVKELGHGFHSALPERLGCLPECF